MKNLKPKQHQEERENSMGFQSYPLRRNTAGSNIEDDKNEMSALYREMEDWYRGDVKREMVQAV